MPEEEKVDYLEVDDKLPGQDWVCLSFVDPDDMVDSKESFKVAKFLQSVCKDKDMDFKRIMDQYKDFTYKFQDELQRDYDEQCGFKTNIRGLKVRGSYSTREEADRRAKKLQTIDADFNVFVGQVGYWLPFNPCADKIEDEHFINSQLNDMMEKYKENSINKDLFYEEQKREKVKEAREEVLRKKREEAEQKKKDEEDNMLKDKEDPVQEDPVQEEVVDGEGSKVVKEVMENLSEDVSMVVEETAKVVEEVAEKVEEVAEKVEEVAEKVEEVAEKVEEGAEAVAEGAEKVEEVSEAVAEGAEKGDCCSAKQGDCWFVGQKVAEADEESAEKVEEVAVKSKDLDADLKKSLDEVDPWMANKLKEQ